MGYLVWFCVEAAAFGQSAPQALSDLMVRRARMFAAIPLAKSSDLELAHRIAVRATELVPADAEAWRLRMDIARLHEEHVDAQAHVEDGRASQIDQPEDELPLRAVVGVLLQQGAPCECDARHGPAELREEGAREEGREHGRHEART